MDNSVLRRAKTWCVSWLKAIPIGRMAFGQNIPFMNGIKCFKPVVGYGTKLAVGRIVINPPNCEPI